MQKPAQLYHRSERRLNQNDKPVRYAREFKRCLVSDSGHFHYRKRSYHLGEAFAGQTVGIKCSSTGVSELYFATLHLANLTLNPGDPLRPAAYMVPPDQIPLAKYNP